MIVSSVADNITQEAPFITTGEPRAGFSSSLIKGPTNLLMRSEMAFERTLATSRITASVLKGIRIQRDFSLSK